MRLIFFSHKPQFVTSIAAGITISQLKNAACGYAIGGGVTDPDKTIVETIFGAVGIALQLEENLMAAITDLSVSGPAYIYLFIEALSDGGVHAGLPVNVATQLAAQTVKGAAEIVLKTGRHTGQLKDGVTSAGRTTIAGVEALEQGAFRGTAMSAVMAVTRDVCCLQMPLRKKLTKNWVHLDLKLLVLKPIIINSLIPEAHALTMES